MVSRSGSSRPSGFGVSMFTEKTGRRRQLPTWAGCLEFLALGSSSRRCAGRGVWSAPICVPGSMSCSMGRSCWRTVERRDTSTVQAVGRIQVTRWRTSGPRCQMWMPGRQMDVTFRSTVPPSMSSQASWFSMPGWRIRIGTTTTGPCSGRRRGPLGHRCSCAARMTMPAVWGLTFVTNSAADCWRTEKRRSRHGAGGGTRIVLTLGRAGAPSWISP